MEYSDLDLSFKITLNGELVGAYFLGRNQLDFVPHKLKGQGIEGVAFALKPEYRNLGIATRALKHLEENFDYNYLWGQQLKELRNIGFWKKTRKIVFEDATMYITAREKK